MKWKENDNKKINYLIEELLKYTDDKGIRMDIYSTIVEHELYNSIESNITYGQLIRTMKELKKSKKKSKEDFEEAFKKVKESENKKLIDWEILIPYNLSINKRVITLFGNKFYFYKNSTIHRKYKKYNLFYLTIGPYTSHPIDILKIDSNFIKVKSKGKTYYEAWNNILTSFNLFRGIIEFLLHYNRWDTVIDQNNVRSFIYHPDLILFINKNESRYIDFNIERSGKDREVKLWGDYTNKLISITNFFKELPKNNSIKNILADCFSLYSFAMDEKFEHQRFHIFWCIAELLTLAKGHKGNTDIVSNRFNFFIHKIFKIPFNFKNTLDKISDKRNEQIHKYLITVTKEETEILIIICENIINWFMDNYNKINNIEHLEEFYKFGINDERKRLAAIKALKLIEKMNI